MKGRAWPFLAAAALGGGIWLAASALRSPDETIETIGFTRPLKDAPSLCPWRTPERDMAEFFPGATRFTTQILVLSGLRVPLQKRLDAGETLEANSLYVYPVWQDKQRRGTVMLQRLRGEYGALEVVVGVGTDGRIAGVRLQRLREPPRIAAVLTAPRWLAAFRGKTADSAWRMGEDIPPVPADAQKTAATLTRGVRTLLIILDVAGKPKTR